MAEVNVAILNELKAEHDRLLTAATQPLEGLAARLRESHALHRRVALVTSGSNVVHEFANSDDARRIHGKCEVLRQFLRVPEFSVPAEAPPELMQFIVSLRGQYCSKEFFDDIEVWLTAFRETVGVSRDQVKARQEELERLRRYRGVLKDFHDLLESLAGTSPGADDGLDGPPAKQTEFFR